MAQLGVLVGLPLGEHELVLSPKVHDYFSMTPSFSHLVSVGTGVGVALRAGESLQVVPEVTVLLPLNQFFAGTPGATVPGVFGAQSGLLAQVGVALLFGGR
jgi:hypothetical protein